MSNLLIGEVFAGFRVEEVLGRGGMGWVYRVHDEALDRERALKVLDPSLAQDEAFRGRFQRESRMAAKIEHPSVVPVYQAGEEDERLFIVMRLIRGPDLQNLVDREGPLDPRRTARIVAAVGEGLDAAHKHGIVHRDVKPANILLELGSEGERVYLTDFGIGRPSDAAGAGLTSTGEVIGTADYIAPEQIRGQRADARSDVYTLGCVACFLLTGEPPFARENQLATLYAHANAERPRPTLLEPALPEEIDDVITRATAVEPSERYESAGELGAAIADAIGRGPRTSTSASTPTVAAAETVRLPPEPAGAPPPAKRPRGPLYALGALGAVAAVAVAAVLLLGGDDEDGGASGTGGGDGTAQGQELDRLGDVESFEVTGGAPASDVVAGKINVLVLSEEESALLRIEAGGPNEGRPAQDPDEVAEPTSVAIGFESVWVTSAGEGTLLHYGPDSREIPTPIPVGADPVDVAVDKAVWVANEEDSTVSRVDPGSLDEAAVEVELNAPPSAIAAASGEVWALSAANDTVFRLDADGTSVRNDTGFPAGIVDLAAAGETLWVANEESRELQAMSLALGELDDRVELEGEPVALAGDDESLWVAARDPNRVIQVDATDREPVARADLDSAPTSISIAPPGSPEEGSVWVAGEDGTISRIRP